MFHRYNPKKFGCDSVKLNITRTKDYVPSILWLAKIKEYRKGASGFFIYVNDVQTIDNFGKYCWRGNRNYGSKCRVVPAPDGIFISILTC